MLRTHLSLRIAVACAALLCVPLPASAQTAPPLGNVASFAVLGGSAVTAAGGAGTVVTGNVGSAPTPTVNGFPPAVVPPGFTVYTAANAITAAARIDAGNAYTNLAGQVCPAGNHIAGGVLDGLNLVAGVYCMPTGSLTGTLTLTGGPADIWVFQTTLDTLTTAGASHVVMAGAANACNVYWQVSSSATLGGASTFSGNLFAGVSNTLGTSAAVVGRVVAGSGAVTLAGTDTVGGCSSACPLITLTPLPVGAVGVAYSVQIRASGGTGSYTFAVSSGTLPAGLTLTAGGLLSGTPTALTSSPVTIQASDGNGCPGLVTLTIAAPVPPPVPTLPQTFVILLALGLVAVGYARLRRRPRTE
jgi:hypothetical protein